MPTWKNVVCAALHDSANVKVVDIQEGGNGNAKNVASAYCLVNDAGQEVFDEFTIGLCLRRIALPGT